MRALILITLALALAAPAPAAANGIWQAFANGRNAEAQFSDPAGGGGVVNVFQNGGASFLVFAVWVNDPTSQQCTEITDEFGTSTVICVYTRAIYDYGWGELPSADIAFSDTSAHLMTTTGPGFTVTRCTTDSSTPTPTTTCSPGPASSFDLTWDQNDLYSQSRSGVSQRNYGSFIFWTSGVSRARSAYVDGSALGHALLDAPGTLGGTRGLSVVRPLPPAP